VRNEVLCLINRILMIWPIVTAAKLLYDITTSASGVESLPEITQVWFAIIFHLVASVSINIEPLFVLF
jgi:hypothetical protein